MLTLFVQNMKHAALPASLLGKDLLDLSRNIKLKSLDIRFWQLRPMKWDVDLTAPLSCVKPAHPALE